MNVNHRLLIAFLLLTTPARAQTPEPKAETQAQEAKIRFSTPMADILRNTAFDVFSGDANFTVTMRALDGLLTQWVEVDVPSIYFRGVELGAAQISLREHPDTQTSDLNAAVKSPFFEANASLEGQFTINPETRRLNLSDGPIEGTIRFDLGDLKSVRDILGIPLNPKKSTLHLNVSGTTSAPKFEAKLGLEGLESLGNSLGNAKIEWTHGDSDTLTFALERADGSGLNAALKTSIKADPKTLSAEVDWTKPINFTIDGTITDEDVRSVLSLHPAVDFHFKTTGEMSGVIKELSGAVDLSGGLTLGNEKFPTLAKLVLKQGAQDLSVQIEDAGTLAVETKINLEEVAGGNSSWLNSAIQGRLSVDVLAGRLESLFQTFRRADGRLKGDVALSGTISAPALNGELNWLEAGITWTSLNRRIEPLEAKLALEGRTFALKASGEGRSSEAVPGNVLLEGKGEVPKVLWNEGYFTEWSADGTLEIADFPWVQRHYPISTISGISRAKILKNQEEIHIDATIDSATIEVSPERMPKTGNIPMNPDIVIVDAYGEQTQARSILEGAGKLRLDLKIAEALQINGQGNNIQVTGAMQVHRDGHVVRVEGGFEPRGTSTFMLFENQMNLSHGIVTLADGNLRRQTRIDASGAPEASPLEPTIELVARGDVENSTVLVRLKGPLSRPSLTLASQPPIPEYEIISLLVTGRADAVDDRNGNVRKAAQDLVERYHNPSLQKQLFARIGIDKLGFGFGSSVTNPILTVGKQLTRDLYVETVYHHGAPPDANMMEGRVEQRLDTSWTLNTAFGDAAEGRFGLFWKTKFGAPDPPEISPEEWAKLNTFEVSDDDEDGVSNRFDLCPSLAEDMDGFEDEDGCPDPDNDGDGIPDISDKAPLFAEVFNGFEDEDGAPDEAPPRLEEFEAEIGAIRFERNQTLAEADSAIEAVAELLVRYPFLRATVVGHSDTLGDESTKARVSEARAQSVRRELIREGVDAERVVAEGRADSALLLNEESEEAHSKNRRVEIQLSVEPEEEE